MTTGAVAFFVQDLHGGGAEKITLELANAFARRGYDVDLICQSLEGAYMTQIDAAVHPLAVGSYSPFRTVLFLRDYLRRRNPQVMFTALEKPSLLGLVAARLAGFRNIVPCVHTHLGSYVLFDHKIRRRLLRTLVTVFYRRAVAVIAVSEGAAGVMRNLLGLDVPVIAIYNGFDLDDMRHRARESVKFPIVRDAAAPIFIAGGRMVPQKGFDVLLRAFARVNRDMPSRLVILGNGPLKNKLKALIQELEVGADVYFPGFVPNPLAWFARADVFVLSSRVEGFGNVLVEALAAGLKVVSTDCPSGPREILKGGKYGALVPVDDVAALADAMKAVAQAPPGSDAAGALAYIGQNFSMAAMIDGYIKVMESLA